MIYGDNDSWRDGYDSWKLASPDDDEDRDYEDECPCDDYDSDWDGRATCNQCGRSFYLTPEQFAAGQRHEAEWAAYCEREERRKFVLWISSPLRWLWHWAVGKISPRLAIKALDDDEIPF